MARPPLLGDVIDINGSFGSGTSHFMAVLYALLGGDPAARARTEFDPVLARQEWLTMDGKRFLLVPHHMLGAKALEQRVLGGYVTHVKKLHPDAPAPEENHEEGTPLIRRAGWAVRRPLGAR